MPADQSTPPAAAYVAGFLAGLAGQHWAKVSPSYHDPRQWAAVPELAAWEQGFVEGGQARDRNRTTA